MKCPLCNAPAHVVETAYPGYRSPSRYEIAVCDDCELSFAVPTRSDQALYELIYSQSAMIPGYDRYDHYAARVKYANDPLAFLASQEENYWALRKECAKLAKDAEILDVGTGLGYLARALTSAGFRAIGLDLSERAVARARRRFGDHYVVADFFDWSRRYPERYDVVAMLELIEHVEDPRAWIEAGLFLIKPGGRLLLSTPNRSFYPMGTVWETEAPLHLWWFSPRAINVLADGAGVSVEFTDFSDCAIPARAAPVEPVRTVHSPMLDQTGRPVSGTRRLLHRFGLLSPALSLYRLRERRSGTRAIANVDPSRRETLVATLRKHT
jgi:SAM-dependent methyltransferase